MMYSSMIITALKSTKNNIALLIVLVFSSFFFVPIETLAQTKIEVSVNNGVVTSYQIAQRSRFLRLTGLKGDSVKEARKQLIDEELQIQETKRVGISLPPNAVETAYSRLAKGNGTDAGTFSKALRQRGVNPDTLKQLIKARILWQQFVTARARAEGNNSRKANDVTSILFNKNGDGENRKIKEYTLEQFIFIVKSDASEKQVQQRLREVESFRRSNATCKAATENAIKLASSGVVTKPLGRFTSDTLPPAMKPAIEEAGDALFTKPKRRSIGIEMMAICKTREIVDNSAAGTLNIEVGQLDTKELEEKSKQWMDDLRTRAVIRNR